MDDYVLNESIIQDDEIGTNEEIEEAIKDGYFHYPEFTPEQIIKILEKYGTKEQIEKFLANFDGVPTEEVLKEIKKLTSNALVVQSNALAEASQDLTSVELRIVYNLIGLLNPRDETDFISTKVFIKDLAKICGLDRRNAYRQIDKACDMIMKKPIIITTTDRNGKKITLRRPWFIQLDTFENENYIQFKFHPDLRDELLQFHKYGKGFVAARKNILNQLGDVFSMRLFNLMLKNLKLKQCEYTIDQFVNMFQLEGKYIDKRTGSINTALFIKRVIESAINKINDVTDLQITYKPVKVGRKIESVRFFIEMKKDKSINIYNNVEIDKPTPEEDISWMKQNIVTKKLEQLKKYGFSEAYRSPTLGKFTNAEDFTAAVNKAITALETSTKHIDKPGAFLFSTIMDYKPEKERFFAEEDRLAQLEQEQKEKEIKNKIADASLWEDIISLATIQTEKEDAINVLKQAEKQRPELLKRYKNIYNKVYPKAGSYELEIEISRINIYGISELAKTPKLNYSLFENKE